MPDVLESESIEQMWLKVTVSGKHIAIGTAYRPPWLDLDLFLDVLTDTISSFKKIDHYILLGDFNVNMLHCNESKTLKIIDFLKSLSLDQVITTPTHFTCNSETLIDLVCTDLHPKSITVEPYRSTYGHSVIKCQYHIKREKIRPYIIKFRPIKHICEPVLQNDLCKVDWSSVESLATVNEMVETFSEHIIALFDKHAPVKTCVIKEPSHPWITDNIKIMMKLRDDALSKYRKYKTETKKAYYQQLKSMVVTSLFYEKIAYFKFNINNKINNPQILWKNIKSTVLPRKQTCQLPPQFSCPDCINLHFLNVPGTTAVNLSYITYYEFHRHSKGVFSLAPVSQGEISKCILSLKSDAEGYDGINLRMLLMTLPHTLKTITHIINTSIQTSTFPETWKKAIILPLPKTPIPSTMKDLRPISILPCLSKVIEKVVCRQLTDYIEKYNLLPMQQSGFRKRHSTATALLDVTDNILSAQDKGMCTLMVLLDYSRAFDSINIPLLLSKLHYYGFDYNTILWFHSYLNNRQQCVKLRLNDGNCVVSDFKPLVSGVPQGSILGPVVFVLYTANISMCIKKCKFHIYADDTQLYISFYPKDYVNALAALNEDLERIAHWSENNSLVLNPDKTKYMLFGTKKQIKSLPSSLNIRLMGKSIERVEEARNLGLYVDSNLRYEKHISETVRNCFFRLKTLYRVRPYLSEDLRVHLVESLVLSRLNYADIVYGPRLLSRTDRLLQRVQNACARYCFNIPPRTHVTPFLNEHGMLKVKSRRKYHLACLMFGVIKFNRPVYLCDKLCWMANNRNVKSRNCAQQLAIPLHRSAAFRGSFRYAASKIWNNLPPPIRQCNNIGTFKKHLRQYLIEAQRKLDGVISNVSFI